MQSRAEGIYVPLGDTVVAGSHELIGLSPALEAYSVGPKWRGWNASSIDAEDADVIDALLDAHARSWHVRVDRRRLRDSHEAWVFVHLETGSEHHDLPWPLEAILTWSNSD